MERSGDSLLNSSNRKIEVWDVPTRLFHWLTAALVFAAYITWRLDWMNWHAKAGYAVLTLIVFRLLWGFAGSDTARFSRFVASPRLALHHLAEIFRREPDHQVGHNPAGAWMVLFLLGLLLGETLSGLYVANDVAGLPALSMTCVGRTSTLSGFARQSPSPAASCPGFGRRKR